MTNERHPSALELGHALLDEKAGSAAREHAATCPRCAAELEAARRDADHFRAAVLPRTREAVLARAGRRRAATWWRWGGAGVGLAAAAAALLLLVRPAHPTDEPDFSVKGVAVKVFARRGSEVFTVRDGVHLRAGDQLRFSVTPGAARFVLVASVDGRGATNLYYPSTPLPAGETVLPGSIELDQSPGPERIFVLFSAAPIDAAAVQASLAAIGMRGTAAIRATSRLPLANPQISLVFDKDVP